jgi:hypothetical protein
MGTPKLVKWAKRPLKWEMRVRKRGVESKLDFGWVTWFRNSTILLTVLAYNSSTPREPTLLQSTGNSSDTTDQNNLRNITSVSMLIPRMPNSYSSSSFKRKLGFMLHKQKVCSHQHWSKPPYTVCPTTCPQAPLTGPSTSSQAQHGYNRTQPRSATTLLALNSRKHSDSASKYNTNNSDLLNRKQTIQIANKKQYRHESYNVISNITAGFMLHNGRIHIRSQQGLPRTRLMIRQKEFCLPART